MKKRISKAIAGVVIILLSLLMLPGVGCGNESTATTTTAAPTKAFIWKVMSNTTSVYMLGSVHFARSDIYPLDDTIEDAFEAADYLVLELDPTEDNAVFALLLLEKYGAYPKGETLKDSIGERLYEDFIDEIATPGGDAETYLEQYRPWVLLLAGSQSMYQGLEYEAEYGIDVHFANEAMKADKEVIALETIKYQITQLSSIPDEVVVRAILADTGTNPQGEIDAMFDAWEEGSSMQMTKIVFGPLEEDSRLEPFYQKIFSERNQNMAEKIEEFLSGSGVYFIVVGAGHLVGEKGLVSLMEKSGYQVEQLYNSD